MTVIFRQRTFSKRWKIRKDWDVGLHHTTATIVEDKECHCLKSDNKIAECILSPSDLEWIKEGEMIFINDDLHGSEDGTYYIISKTMHDTNRNIIVYVEDKIEEDSPSMRNKGELENVLLNRVKRVLWFLTMQERRFLTMEQQKNGFLHTKRLRNTRLI